MSHHCGCRSQTRFYTPKYFMCALHTLLYVCHKYLCVSYISHHCGCRFQTCCYSAMTRIDHVTCEYVMTHIHHDTYKCVCVVNVYVCRKCLSTAAADFKRVPTLQVLISLCCRIRVHICLSLYPSLSPPPLHTSFSLLPPPTTPPLLLSPSLFRLSRSLSPVLSLSLSLSLVVAVALSLDTHARTHAQTHPHSFTHTHAHTHAHQS